MWHHIYVKRCKFAVGKFVQILCCIPSKHVLIRFKTDGAHSSVLQLELFHLHLTKHFFANFLCTWFAVRRSHSNPPSDQLNHRRLLQQRWYHFSSIFHCALTIWRKCDATQWLTFKSLVRVQSQSRIFMQRQASMIDSNMLMTNHCLMTPSSVTP